MHILWIINSCANYTLYLCRFISVETDFSCIPLRLQVLDNETENLHIILIKHFAQFIILLFLCIKVDMLCA
jgi:hypothetical protein